MSSGSLFHGSTVLILNECFLGFVLMYCTQIPCSPTACLVLDLVILWSNSFLYPLSKTCEPLPCQVRSFSPPKFLIQAFCTFPGRSCPAVHFLTALLTVQLWQNNWTSLTELIAPRFYHSDSSFDNSAVAKQLDIPDRSNSTALFEILLQLNFTRLPLS
jgi:hypothetical protein